MNKINEKSNVINAFFAYRLSWAWRQIYTTHRYNGHFKRQ
ncbi:Hypothetical protein ABZS17G119_03622 [Kosakonia cowanii]